MSTNRNDRKVLIVIVTTLRPTALDTPIAAYLNFLTCDECGAWDRDVSFHYPGCSVGKVVDAERAAAAAEAQDVRRAKLATRRREARAAKAAPKPAAPKPIIVITTAGYYSDPYGLISS